MAQLDNIDRDLLHWMQQDNRMSLAELGKQVGLSISSTKERIDKLTARGVLREYMAHVDPEALNLTLFSYIFVGWSDPKLEQPFLDRINAEPLIQQCHHVTGSWNYLLFVKVRDAKMLSGLLNNVIKAGAGVERTETLIVLDTPKDTCYLPTELPDWAKRLG